MLSEAFASRWVVVAAPRPTADASALDLLATLARDSGVAVHRLRVDAVIEANFDLRVEEFPFPMPRVWGSTGPGGLCSLLVVWLRELLVDAAAWLAAQKAAQLSVS